MTEQRKRIVSIHEALIENDEFHDWDKRFKDATGIDPALLLVKKNPAR